MTVVRWTIITHPEAGTAVISEPALPEAINLGWSRIGDWDTDPEVLRGRLVDDPATPTADTTPVVVDTASSTDVVAAPATKKKGR